MARTLAALALACVCATASGCGARARPSIRIVGWEVVGSAVIVKVNVTGWRLVPPRQGPVPQPRTGQWQIYVGDRYAGFSYNRSWGTVNGLAAGTYRVWAVLARSDYSLVWPLIRSQSVVVHVSGDAD
jgi:hypothetical protein